jgi:hypothetical protein
MNIRDRNICIWCAIKEGATQASMAVKYNLAPASINSLYWKMENKLNAVTEYEEIEGFV